jgi:glycosyltransferase involved in cell wall biosynthesis
VISSIPLYSREVPRIFSDGTPISLSICIPTYNRSEALCELIRQVLSCPAQDIEVVVLDNGSTDCTLEKLAEIKDSRLTVYSNEINRGVLFNVINVLLLGRGYHTVLLLDKDSLDPLSIEKFKQFLSEEDPACGYSRYHLAVDSEPDIAAAGIPASVSRLCRSPPDWLFFRTALLHQLEIEQRFCTYSFVGHFPFDFILAECSLLGAAAIYNAPAFAPEDLTSAAKNKSFGTNAGKEDAFFSPKGRLKMAINFTRHISGLSVPATIKRQFVLNFLPKECLLQRLVTVS